MTEDASPEGFGFARLFTVAEANALLPVLVPVLERLRDDKRALDEIRQQFAALAPAMRGNGHGAAAVALEQRLVEVAQRLAEGVARVRAYGVEVKDLDQGLIDFPARRGRRVVYLCWRLGEGPIAFWHELDAGFAGRRPLETDEGERR